MIAMCRAAWRPSGQRGVEGRGLRKQAMLRAPLPGGSETGPRMRPRLPVFESASRASVAAWRCQAGLLDTEPGLLGTSTFAKPGWAGISLSEGIVPVVPVLPSLCDADAVCCARSNGGPRRLAHRPKHACADPIGRWCWPCRPSRAPPPLAAKHCRRRHRPRHLATHRAPPLLCPRRLEECHPEKGVAVRRGLPRQHPECRNAIH